MIKDDLLPATVTTCAPESDAEAIERVSAYAPESLIGLTDTVYADVGQLKRALADIGWRSGKPEQVADGGRKKIVALRPTMDGIRYVLWIVETARLAKVEVVEIDKVPRDLKDMRDQIDSLVKD